MSRLEKLMAKPKMIEIAEEEFEIWPLTNKHLDIILGMDSDDRKERAKCMRQVIDITLMRAVPDATQEELDGISLEFLAPIIEAIVEVNGLSDEKATALKERLDHQRSLKG